jgi:LysM repeat protein
MKDIPMTRFPLRLGITWFGIATLLAAHAHAYSVLPSHEAQDLITYTVKSGDTLLELSRKYFVSSLGISQVARINQLEDADRITVGQTLSIPRQSVKHWTSIARVMGMSCASSYTAEQGSTRLAVGMPLQEGALIKVPAGCHTALLLEDSSIVRLPSGAVLKLSTLRKNALEKAPEVRLELATGRVELDVMKERSPLTPFEIRTPRSVMGVRGTQFRVGFSPDTQGSLVEVTQGVVKTQGAADAEFVDLTQGMGITIDASGKASVPETLLPPPRYTSFSKSPNHQTELSVQLQHMDNAGSFQADIATTANLSGLRQTQQWTHPEFKIDRLINQAMFYQVAAISKNGLVGTPALMAFCAAPISAEQARCSAVFETPLAEGASITFTLNRQNGAAQQEVIRTGHLTAVNGKFAVKDLQPGHYSWSLSYPLAKASADQAGVNQSGAFELIALPTAAP